MQRITGGSIKASTVQEMIKASYNNNQGYDTIGEYNKDKSKYEADYDYTYNQFQGVKKDDFNKQLQTGAAIVNDFHCRI